MGVFWGPVRGRYTRHLCFLGGILGFPSAWSLFLPGECNMVKSPVFEDLGDSEERSLGWGWAGRIARSRIEAGSEGRGKGGGVGFATVFYMLVLMEK
ncbi:hypothetical protein B0T18DRAFT_410676 [Schizothecium vesticola]|uniref:Uncharacterized protein n=1 Tax=Schizothecium vesticola TaxID=314040 RepID=A0AA40EV50_9PEZI|nr:hypothetical protein B0T18DRAFT_410676 [Schizothecium vesticola]